MGEQAKIAAAKQALEQPLDDGQTDANEPPPQWMAGLDERTNKHIAFARNYAASYAHGAPGHLDLMTIAALAKLLDDHEEQEKTRRRGFRLPQETPQ